MVFTKLVRTKWRAQAIAFSQFSVICQQDGQLSLMFRIADRHTSRIIGARIRATLVSQTRTTREGHVVTLDQQPLRLHPSGEDSDLLLLWPTTIVHSITVESPLYGMNEADMMQAAFEIIVTLEGTTSSTDMSTQAMSSYLPCEILWGYRFDDMIGAKSDNGRPTVDHSLMDSIYPVGITAEDNGSVEFSPDLGSSFRVTSSSTKEMDKVRKKKITVTTKKKKKHEPVGSGSTRTLFTFN